MTDFSTNLSEPEAPELSTQLDQGGRTTEGAPSKEPADDSKKPESRMDAIKRAAADMDKEAPAEAKESAAKPEDAKPEPKPDERPADAEARPDTEKPVEAKQEERPRKSQIEAPERFLPRAKELWHNTPHEVRSEMQRVITEHETAANQARESVREYEAVRPYAEMAKQSGTTIDVALGKYVQMEQALRSDPARGFRELASNMQMTPQQMIGHIAAAFNVEPERLAAHMMQAPNEYTALAPRQPVQQQPQPNNEVRALQQQLQQLQQSMAHRDIESTIIAPFAAENPRYHELQGSIAAFLKSDMIPASLSPQDRLAAAYDMAVRISPSPRSAPAPDLEDGDQGKSESRAGEDFGGTKSVRGAPASGVDTTSRRRGKMSRGDAISAAMSEFGLAH